ncbi:MAG: hypothetical protein ACM3JP_03130 [Betaproteobacteria bacterium]
MMRLIRLYPKRWRTRYGDEFTQLVRDLGGAVPERWLAFDIGRGALDAHWREGFGMRRLLTDPALRRGFYDGLILTALIAIDILLTVVIFPAGPDEGDSNPEYIVQDLATLAVVAVLLMAIGARGRRRTADTVAGQAHLSAGARAGAAAGVIMAILVTATYLAVNNIWFSVVSQQHDKRISFAASGWTSMRSYINVVQIEGLVVLVPALGIGGAVLGLAGAWLLRRPRNPQHA